MFKRTSLKTAAIWRNTVRVSVICVGVAMYRHVWLQCTVHLVVTSNTRVTRARFKGPWVEGLWNCPTLLNSKELGCCVAVFNGHWVFHLFHVSNKCHNDYHTKATQITRKKKLLIMYSTSGSYINYFKLDADNCCWQLFRVHFGGRHFFFVLVRKHCYERAHGCHSMSFEISKEFYETLSIKWTRDSMTVKSARVAAPNLPLSRKTISLKCPCDTSTTATQSHSEHNASIKGIYNCGT